MATSPDDERGEATLRVPVAWVVSVSALRLPAGADRRVTDLMDRNNDGLLTAAERAELGSLVEICETLSLVRAGALHLLGHRPR